MALSDCEKCWDTPCSCGWGYKDWSETRLSDFIANITWYRSKESALKILKEAKDIVELDERKIKSK